jgi:hypothetical protein
MNDRRDSELAALAGSSRDEQRKSNSADEYMAAFHQDLRDRELLAGVSRRLERFTGDLA